MRFAVSAVAAVSGLFLLGVAFYGQPALYVQQAREKWDELIAAPADDQPPALDRDATAEQLARLQQQVAKLEDELTAKQVSAARSTVQQPQPTLPLVTGPLAPDPEAKIDQAPPVQPKASQSVTGSTTSRPGPAATVSMAAPQPAAPPVTAPPPEASHGVVLHLEKPDQQIVAPATLPSPPAVPIPEQHETASAVPVAPKSEVSKIEQPKRVLAQFGPPKPESAAVELPRADVSKPTPARVAAPKPVPAPPPLPEPPPIRQNDDTPSVLARLRQLPPGAASVQPPDVVPPVEPRPRPISSPSLPGLTAARAALANGRIEDARRLLQQAQLQLVFRPVNVAGDESPGASKGAADVANALNALSANDVPLGRRYVDAAVGDLSGNGTGPPIQEPAVRTTGYAPAYPPH